MNKISLLFVVIFAVIYTAFAQKEKVHKYKLDNGLTVILYEDHSKPEVYGIVAVKAGGKNDPEDATGMAHYQEHMLFKGTQDLGTTDWEKEKPHIDRIFELYDELGNTTDEEKRKEIQTKINKESLEAGKYAIPNELSNILKSIGGTNLNAGTGPDMTVFYNAFPSNQMEKWLEIYSHRFMKPVFRSFQAELEVVYEEKNLYSDIFFYPLLEEFNRNFFKKHPYGQHTLIGTVDDLKNPSLTKMYKFFQTYYVANNMALILVGDFNTDEVKPMIEEKFGKWKSGVIPEQKKYEEKPFNGREFVEKKMSPIKLGLLGYRIPPNGDDDKVAMDVCNGVLSNENQSGLLDKLSLDNKLLAVQLIPIEYNDYGCGIILFIPKILGQKLEDAEGLITAQLEKLRNGDFDDWVVDAVKLNLYRDYELSMESKKNIAYELVNSFVLNKPIEEIFDYSEKLKKITKEDVIKVANKYYNENYLAFYSKMGFPKKEKIEKPGYEPLKVNTNAKSKFAEKLEKMESKDPVEKYVDFNNDIQTMSLNGDNTLYYTKNTVNDIFTLKLKYGIGEKKMPLLAYASQIMNYSGTEGYDLNQVKQEFSKIGCSYYIYSDKSYLIIEVSGVDKNIEAALDLVQLLVTKPVLDPEKLDIIVSGEKTNRKMERSEPDNIADALFDYVRYGDKSDYIDRLSVNKIKKLNTDTLVNKFRKATTYQTDIYVCSSLEADEISRIIEEKNLVSGTPKKSTSPEYTDIKKYNENKIFFVNKRNAVQSKVYLLINGKIQNHRAEPAIDAFNLYFGGGFSGLVLQEIREYRSMAYSAGASYRMPWLAGKESYFVGYVGTQCDKTNEAIDIFVDLIRNMPEKTERMEMIKPYLIQSAFSNRPDFRGLAEQIKAWELQGYDEDPAKYKIPGYKKLSFSDITDFYKNNIKDKPLVICIVGNKKQIDTKSLEQYGKIVKINEKNLFTK